MTTLHSAVFSLEAFKEDTYGLTGRQRRVYLELLMHAMHGPRGGVVAEERALRHLLDMTEHARREFGRDAQPVLDQFFELSPDGYYRQKRALAERFLPILLGATRGRSPKLSLPADIKGDRQATMDLLKDVAQEFIEDGWDGREAVVIDNLRSRFGALSVPKSDTSRPKPNTSRPKPINGRAQPERNPPPQVPDIIETHPESFRNGSEMITHREKRTRKRNISPLPPTGGMDVDELFDRFWKAYPSRGRGNPNPRKPAETKFRRICRDGKADPEAIIAAAASFNAHVVDVEGDERPKKVCHAITWLNQERWTAYEPETKPDPQTPDGLSETLVQWVRGAAWPKNAGPPPTAPDFMASPDELAAALALNGPGTDAHRVRRLREAMPGRNDPPAGLFGPGGA